MKEQEARGHVAWETRCEEAFEHKQAKYAELMEQSSNADGSVGCLLLKWEKEDLQPSPYMGNTGVKGRDRKKTAKSSEPSTEKASSWLWPERWKLLADT